MENATKFFHACESGSGWDACKEYVAEGATFFGQCEPLTEVKSVEEYAGWMAGFAAIAPDLSYKVNAAAYDSENNKAIIFATDTATHTGEGGPVPPTNKTTVSDYVYALSMNDEGKVTHMHKIWNASWALREFGWM